MRNLQPWQKGISGNPNGRPKGSRNIKSIIRDLLNDPDSYNLLPRNALRDTQTPLEAIISMLMIKSIRGDVRAADVLLKYTVDREILAEEGGFFSQEKLIIRIVGEREDITNLVDIEEPSAIVATTG